MSKRDEFRRIAKAAGIKSPEIEYIQSRKVYAIGITIKNPDKTGYFAPSVGVYENLNEAQANIKEDLKRFLLKYPEAKEKVTGLYDAVTKQASSEMAKEYVLEQIQRGLSDKLWTLEDGEDAANFLSEINAIIEKIKSTKKPAKRGKKSNYKSKMPDAKKAPIAWEQPDERIAPVYHFDITCPYCGTEAHLERFSPNAPSHCGKDDCSIKHERELARVRKQRQRAREKAK